VVVLSGPGGLTTTTTRVEPAAWLQTPGITTTTPADLPSAWPACPSWRSRARGLDYVEITDATHRDDPVPRGGVEPGRV